MVESAHILVLNYNGRTLLEQCLPSVVACARAATVRCRVTVIDNESRDDSVKWFRRTWPSVGLMRMPNRCLVSFNEAVRDVGEPVVLLLNNDVKLAPGCVDRLAETFDRHPDCFLAGPLCWTFDGRYEGTRSALRFRRGLVHTELDAGEEDRGQKSEVSGQRSEVGRYTASAGAVMAVHRERFLALGGFDPLYLPGRFEDLDLAFRGWLAGWKAYYVPDAVAYHKGSATFGARFGHRAGRELDARNALLFAWKNLREPRHVAIHLTYLMLRLARSFVTGETSFFRGWAGAMRRLPQALECGAAATERVRSERELFDMLGMGKRSAVGNQRSAVSGQQSASSNQLYGRH